MIIKQWNYKLYVKLHISFSIKKKTTKNKKNQLVIESKVLDMSKLGIDVEFR